MIKLTYTLKLAFIILLIYSLVSIQDARSADFGSRYLTGGDTWNLGNGFSITANAIDARATPKQVWLTLSDSGVKLNDQVITEGQEYSYIPTGGTTAIFRTTVDSIQAGGISDIVLLTNTWTERPAASVTVSSFPSGASIYLDRSYQGLTPFTITNVAAGSHTITLSLTGYQDWSGTVNVVAGTTSSVNPTLSPATGSISVSSFMSGGASIGGAGIYLDGSYQGTTPFTITNVTPGSHDITLKLTGYQDCAQTVNVVSGETSTASCTLIQLGSISVSSFPSGASIYIDGSYQQTTPFTITNVAPGSHTVALQLTHYQDCSQTVNVISSGTSTVSCTLTPNPGSISVSSSPIGAIIYLDGNYEGTTPKTIPDVSAGSHTIKLSKQDYNDIEESVTVTADQTTDFYRTLTQETGSVEISSDPPGAEVYLDSVYKGTTPITIPKVDVGSHTIKLSKQDYYDIEKTITATAYQTTPVSENLIHQTGSVEILSNPTGAGIYLDGIYKGITPTTLTSIPTGTHSIVIKKFGYSDFYQSINIQADSTKEVNASINLSSGFILFLISIFILITIGIVFYGKKKSKRLFSWDQIPGNDSARLTDFLKSNYDVDWIKTAKIAKTDNNKTIMITAEKNSLSLNLNNENTELNLIIDNGKPDKFIVKTENGKLNIYESPIVAVPLRGTVETVLKRKYKVIRLLHTGGMGLVYEGEYNGNKCIIKEPKPTTRVTERNIFLEKIKIEAEILSKIDHDNIVGYIDSFEENNSFYLVEEYVKGENLEDKFYNNPGSRSDVLNCTLQLLNAVRYLHMKQIKHRDIKPDNLILTSDKRLVLIDFGTAKHFDRGLEEPKGISQSTVLGTQCYAAPEQWKGGTTEASDIFSIGRTIYFMLTGENPPNSSDARLDFQGKKVDEKLAAFVIKAAEPEVKDRYKSADQMINLLNIIKDDVGKIEMKTRVLK